MTKHPKTVHTELRDDAIFVRLARPDVGNALDSSTIEDLHSALDDVEATPPTALILEADGRGFCGGFDLTNLASETDASLLMRFVRIELLLQRIAAAPCPTVAFVHGFAYGAGADLVAACDHRVATPDCLFSFPGARFGVVLGTFRLAARIGTDTAQRLLAATRPVAAASVGALVTKIANRADWPALRRHLAEPHPAESGILHELLERSRPRRDDVGDLDALVRSASRPGLKDRMSSYVQSMKAARDPKKRGLVI